MISNGDATDPSDEGEASIDDVLTELEELEEIVDSDTERDQVRETMRVLRRAEPPGVVVRFRSAFGWRDVGEALVGSFVFGIPMIVEDGTFEVGAFVARHPPFFALTLLMGIALVAGILYAGRFDEVTADRLFGVIPVRLIGIVAVAVVLAVGLTTIWGRVDWTAPRVALAQSLVIAIVMAVGAAVGDALPER